MARTRSRAGHPHVRTYGVCTRRLPFPTMGWEGGADHGRRHGKTCPGPAWAHS
jgi:hypothetical protein